MRLAAALLAVAIVASTSGEAHKPITSPYTFNEHVFPILRRHCGACHVSGGVAPMSLMTHADAVPWGESMRLELIAGHMPPWSDATMPGLSARELDTLMTWASGGTPPGDDARTPAPLAVENTWRLGPPDVELPLPEFTLDADTQERVAEFVLPGAARSLRALDLRPGMPAIVRSATVSATDGQTLLLWQPGDTPRALPAAAFRTSAGDEWLVRIRYRKTWEYERRAMTDRSTLGLYLADAALPAVERLDVATPGRSLDRETRVLAVAPSPDLTDVDVRLDAVRANGERTTLLTLRPTAGWTRRYWLVPPVTLPRGTRLQLDAPDTSLTLDVTGGG